MLYHFPLHLYLSSQVVCTGTKASSKSENTWWTLYSSTNGGMNLHRWNAFSGVRIEACNKTFQPWFVAKVSGVILETIASIMTLLVAVFWQVDYVYTDQTRAYDCKQDFEIDLHFHGGI